MTLNDQLLPENSPIAENQGQTSSFDFDSENEAGVISTAKIKNLAVDTAKINNAAITNAKIEDLAVTNAKINDMSFNKGQGGTLTLGGTANGNGVFSLKNSAGTEIIHMDNTGMLVNGGSIIIKDNVGTTIMDASGLVSTANFTFGTANNTSVGTYSGTSYADISNTTITTEDFRRTTNVFITYTANIRQYLGNASVWAGRITLNIDGTDQADNVFEQRMITLCPITPPVDYVVLGLPITASGIVQLTSGTHTLKLRANTVNSNSELIVDTSEVIYISLGK